MLNAETLSIEPSEAPGLSRDTGLLGIPLNLLILSGLNVRTTERDADVAALAEDIAARGLKQNLVVTPAHFTTGDADEVLDGAEWAYRYEVVAGGRRLQALRRLAADGRLPEDHPVPCMLEQRGEARETSLSENLHRVAMNPADEFEAFAAIVSQLEADGTPREEAIATCARRFGVTARHVEGRLRLAALAPEILQALRENAIGLESAKAYAGTEDHKLQMKVFAAQAKSNWKPHDPASVRQDLRGDTISLDDTRMKFVGIEAYRAAGGRTEAEMFMGSDGEERALDGKLLDQLVKAKAEPLIPALAKADGVKEGLYAPGIGNSARWPKAPEGMERQGYWEEAPTKTARKKWVGIYALNYAGEEVERVGFYRPKRAEQAESGYKPMTDEERMALQRERTVAAMAAQMAVGKFAGTPLEGRAFWPTSGYSLNPVQEREDGSLLVAVLVKVEAADREAQLEAAGKRYDELLEEAAAEAAAERAAREAAAEARDGQHEPDPDDDFAGDFVDDDEDQEIAAD
jgi:ParB family transcriptional regulator, chromosome partitioning protein